MTEAATPGSYGLAPSGFRLPDATRLGPVSLQVADLERSLGYYRQVLGLRLLERDGARARLGAAETVLVELAARAGAKPVPRRGRTGLFHFAVLLPDRAALGRFVRHLGDLGMGAGSADHLVSEALYLHDPDGLGIEVYADRPRSAWRRVGRELRMTTDPLVLADLLEAAGDTPWTGVPDGTVMGHVHLHVGDLRGSADFFSQALGFDRMVWDYPGALFLGAGGYHHHLGTNVWAGRDATPPPADEAQLLHWTVELPDAASVDAAADSLRGAGHEVEASESTGSEPGITVRDPWGTVVVLRAAAA